MRNWSPVRPVIFGFAVIATGIGGFAVWALTLNINGAVVAAGRIEVEARNQRLQHPDGGLVAAIEVRDGDAVVAGQPLVRIDGTEMQAQYTLLKRNLRETLARMDRLLAEVKGETQLQFRPELATGEITAELAEILDAETALFFSRNETIAQTLRQLDERQVQTKAKIEGYQRQVAAGNRQLEMIEQELTNQRALYEDGLTQFSRVSALERERAEIEGKVGQLEAQIAEAHSAIAADQIERLRIAAARREEAQDELRQLQPQEVQLRESLQVVDVKLGRLVLRAPMSGRVLGLKIHTVGGVITPGSDILSIVPGEVPLVFTVRIAPQQIDRVMAGQPVTLRFPNFDSRTTPTLHGTVRSLAADIVTDETTQTSYFSAELIPTEASAQDIAALSLQPGMPIEAFIQTGARTPASLLVKPFTDYFVYALRED